MQAPGALLIAAKGCSGGPEVTGGGTWLPEGSPPRTHGKKGGACGRGRWPSSAWTQKRHRGGPGRHPRRRQPVGDAGAGGRGREAIEQSWSSPQRRLARMRVVPSDLAEGKPAMKDTQQAAQSATGEASEGFTDEERVAVRERARELTAAAR